MHISKFNYFLIIRFTKDFWKILAKSGHNAIDWQFINLKSLHNLRQLILRKCKACIDFTKIWKEKEKIAFTKKEWIRMIFWILWGRCNLINKLAKKCMFNAMIWAKFLIYLMKIRLVCLILGKNLYLLKILDNFYVVFRF